jgi:hypothetical protein
VHIAGPNSSVNQHVSHGVRLLPRQRSHVAVLSDKEDQVSRRRSFSPFCESGGDGGRQLVVGEKASTRAGGRFSISYVVTVYTCKRADRDEKISNETFPMVQTCTKASGPVNR